MVRREEGDVMSATVAAALKKAAVYILGDEKKRGKLVTVVLSAAVGLLLLLCAPAVMLSSLGEVGEEAQVPELHINADDFYSSLDSESRQRLDDIRSAGNDIANAMDEKGVKVQTIKAQLIYMWFCQYHLTHFIRTRIMQRERYDHSRAFFELPEAAHRWRCRFFCWPSNSYNISRS